MIDTLRTMAQPLFHLVMAHTQLTIVGLGLLLMWTAGLALLKGWQNERFRRELASTSSGSREVMRRYAPSGAAPSAVRARESTRAPEAEPASALPPVRGGRTYARNLGNALQKAGMAPPVYTPPTPAGWGPPATLQPGRGAPTSPPPYALPTPPWATPAPAMPHPAPSPTQAPGPPAWPGYAPPSQPQGFPPQPGQPGLPLFGSPRSPAGPPVPQAPMYVAPAPPLTVPPQAPGVPLSEPVPPPLPSWTPSAAPPQAMSPAAPMEAPPLPPAPAKPKRRRFSLSVLQNLEKTIQRTTGLGQPTEVAEPPQPAPAPTQAAVMPEVTAPRPSARGKAPAAPPPPVVPVMAPSVEVEEAPAPVAEEEAPMAVAEEPPTAVVEEEPPAFAPEAEAEEPIAIEVVSSTHAAPAATQPEAPVSDTRAAMRAMLFGEEPAAATADAEKAEAQDVEAEKAGAEKATAEKAESETVEAIVEPVAEPVAEDVAEPTIEAEEPVFRFEPVVIEPSPHVEETAAEEPQAEPVEAAEHYELPVKTPAEPRRSIWETEPSELAPTVASDEREPEVIASPLDTGLAEAVPAEAHGGTPDFGPAPSGGDRGNLVIIEDDPGVAEYYATLFRGNGYNVHVANDGMSGVDLCTKVQPQVILLDVMMPRQNGMLVLQTLRATDETKETPVVVLSNFSEPTLVKRALQLGALEYVIKTQVEGVALLEAMPRWMNREKAFAAA